MDLTKRIVNILTEERKNSGTGFYFCENMIFTCSHVCPKRGNVVYFTERVRDEVYEAVIVYVDYDADIAILKSDKISDNYFKLEKHTYVINEECDSFGFPREDALDMWSRNMTYGGESIRAGRHQLGNANSITNGFSGAPVWNKSGSLLGMLVANARTDNGRNIFDAFMIGVEILLAAFQKMNTNELREKNEFEKILDFDETNYAVYNNLVTKIREGEIIVPLLGNSISEYAFGRKKGIIEQLCMVLFRDPKAYEVEQKKEMLMEGEIGLSIDILLKTPNRYREVLVDFFKDIYSSCYISEFQSEEEVIALIPYMQYAIRFMPDGLLEKIAKRRRMSVYMAYSEQNSTHTSENSFEIYSLCGNLEKKILHSLTDYTGSNEKCYEKLIEWLGMKRILYIGINFEKNTIEFCKKMCSDQTGHFALVACEEEKRIEMRQILEEMKISAILYEQNDVVALEYILHKLLVDTHNERFERRYNPLDYRFSQQILYGRDKEVETLQRFLDSNYDVEQGLPFLWSCVYGEVGSGKSKLIYDFSRKNSSEWQLVWVDCNRNEKFLAELNEFVSYLDGRRLEKHVLLVFDDFYLHSFAFEKIIGLISHKPSHKLRIVFVTDGKQPNLFEFENKKIHRLTEFSESPIEVKPLQKDAIIRICVNYAEYLRNSAIDKIYQRSLYDNFNDLKIQISKVYDRCVKEKENLILYNCLIKTLKWLGLLDANDGDLSEYNVLMRYMLQDKLNDNLKERGNNWDIGRYTEDVYESYKNRKDLKLHETNDYIHDI